MDHFVCQEFEICTACKKELAPGERAFTDSVDQVFCSDECGDEYTQREDFEDPYDEIARENGEAAIRRNRESDDW